ncbi:MAG: class I adenylate cyclase [Desulfobacteraceae bacterium]|jgi:adenylate cyclase class 1
MIFGKLNRNKKKFIAYNDFRKKIFYDLSPKEAEIILYLLPWLLSVNEPKIPGYVSELVSPFRIYNIDYDRNIRRLETQFKRNFGITKQGTLLRSTPSKYLIQGLYTIGSIGSIAQTSTSDCDIWLCIEKKSFDPTGWKLIKHKTNLIKDWLDNTLKMPVYFFISDVEAIRKCHFGYVDSESCGTTQQQVLKEEFYRTCMVICGKTPFWWLCYDSPSPLNYEQTLTDIQGDGYWEYDIIDFGDIEQISPREYFGAALWQFHKSLSRPLKSLIKILLLRSLLEAPQESLLCHQLRELVMTNESLQYFPDFNVSTIESILATRKDDSPELTKFIMECFYIRCEINPYDKNHLIKNKLISKLLTTYPINKKRQTYLRKIKDWDFIEQIYFGNRIFEFLLKIYREISNAIPNVASKSDQKDLTILGRKISAFYEKKKYKISVIQKPTGDLNLSNLTLILKNNIWQVFNGNNLSTPLLSSNSIIQVMAHLVWNNLFSPATIRMRPNSSNVTLQEIINLGKKMSAFFGNSCDLEIDYTDYIKEETIEKVMVVLDFETSPWYIDSQDYHIIYINCWGELFVRRFPTPRSFKTFMRKISQAPNNVQVSYYVQRNASSFEKIIQRTKQSTSDKTHK